MGNAKRLEAFLQRKSGLSENAATKGTARARLTALFDEGSFNEVYAYDNGVPDSVTAGYGAVNGRQVFAYAQDVSAAGAIGITEARKIACVQDMALKVGAPVVAFIGSGNAQVTQGMDLLSGIGEVLSRVSTLSGVVPQLTVVNGACVGLASYIPAMSDFVFMVGKDAAMTLNGAAVIADKTGKSATLNGVGGAKAHSAGTGLCGFTYDDDDNAIKGVRALIDLLPSNNLDSAPLIDTLDTVGRTSQALDTLIPDDDSAPYDVCAIIKEVVDNGEVIECSAAYAPSMVTALARMNGQTVGFVANQTKVEDGVVNAAAARKATRFIRVCDAFNIPVITIVDGVGLDTTSPMAQDNMVAEASKLVSVYTQASVPLITIIAGKAYGSAYVAMGSKAVGADVVFAYPSAQIGILPPPAAALLLYRDKMKGKKGADASVVAEEYKDTDASCYNASALGYVDSVIQPSATREAVIMALTMLDTKRVQSPDKKHNNYPL